MFYIMIISQDWHSKVMLKDFYPKTQEQYFLIQCINQWIIKERIPNTTGHQRDQTTQEISSKSGLRTEQFEDEHAGNFTSFVMAKQASVFTNIFSHCELKQW